jgi:hypothetical protein
MSQKRKAYTWHNISLIDRKAKRHRRNGSPAQDPPRISSQMETIDVAVNVIYS